MFFDKFLQIILSQHIFAVCAEIALLLDEVFIAFLVVAYNLLFSFVAFIRHNLRVELLDFFLKFRKLIVIQQRGLERLCIEAAFAVDMQFALFVGILADKYQTSLTGLYINIIYFKLRIIAENLGMGCNSAFCVHLIVV